MHRPLGRCLGPPAIFLVDLFTQFNVGVDRWRPLHTASATVCQGGKLRMSLDKSHLDTLLNGEMPA